MIIKDEKLTFDDVTIVPANVSPIRHRSNCNPYYKEDDKEYLPVFCSPMGALIDDKNYTAFDNNHIIPIIPRTVSWKRRVELLETSVFVAMSYDEAAVYFGSESNLTGVPDKTHKYKICIDVANGHMDDMITTIGNLKEKWGDNLIIMSGNIANPETYRSYCRAKCDYVRVGIGGGSRCTTSCLTAVHYPMASLIEEIAEYKNRRKTQNQFYTKIVADGGIKNYADAIKALALGADYVMIGKMFAECIEAAEPIYHNVNRSSIPETIPESSINYFSKRNYVPGNWKRKYYGMSTHVAQELINAAAMSPVDSCNFKLKGEEGIVEEIDVKTTLKNWSEGFVSALTSAMSYTGKTDIKKFVLGDESIKLVKITPNSFAAFNKKV